MLGDADIHKQLFEFLARRLDQDRVLIENEIRRKHVVTDADADSIQKFISVVVDELAVKALMP